MSIKKHARELPPYKFVLWDNDSEQSAGVIWFPTEKQAHDYAKGKARLGLDPEPQLPMPQSVTAYIDLDSNMSGFVGPSDFKLPGVTYSKWFCYLKLPIPIRIGNFLFYLKNMYKITCTN